MFKRFSMNFMVLLFLIDLVIIQAMLALAMRLRFVLPFGQTVLPEWSGSFVYTPSLALHVVVGALWAVSLFLGSVYTPRKVMFWMEELQRLWLAHTVAALSLAGILYLAKKELPRLTFVYFYLLALILLVAYRWVYRAWYRLVRNKSQSTTRILIAGAGKVGENLVTRLHQQHWSAYELVGFVDDAEEKQGAQVMGVPVLGKLDDAYTVVQTHAVDEVVIALPLHAYARLANLVTRLYELPIRLHVVPDYFDLAFHAATIESLAGIPLIGLRDPAIDGFQRFVKRLVDVAITSLSMIVFAPIMTVVAVAIKLDDGGPLLYRAPRIGENGRIFHMLKFRSMVVGADKVRPNLYQSDEQGRVLHKRADDPRVTRVGRFIRRTSVDELPQLFNVLRGDMSLVGPRPELPWLVNEYEPWQRKRFAVPQGITGWWQINGRSENPMHLNTDQDLYYIQHYSLWLDLQILWRTVGVVLRGRGAY